MDFFSTLSLDAPNAHLVVRGELDAFAAAQLRQRLDEAVDRGCVSFTVDASEVVFVDAGGLGLLVRLRNTVTPYGGSVVAVATSPRFRQVMSLAGLDEAFGLDLLPDTPVPRMRPVTIAARGRHVATGRPESQRDAASA